MTAVAADQLSDVIHGLGEVAEAALGSESAAQFSALEKHVNDVQSFVRETQQAMWSDEAKTTIKNLERGQSLSNTDLDVIRTFLVSDAARYLEHENDFENWKRELFSGEFWTGSRALDLGLIDGIGDLRGVLIDAVRLVPDIRNYLEERQRVEKLNRALESLNDASRKMLTRLMKEQLQSPDR